MNYVGNHFTDNVGKKRKISKLIGITGSSGISPDKLFVLLILCLQNSLFTVLRRYSQGILKENYSKHEVLLFGEVIKMSFTAFVIYRTRKDGWPFCNHILFLVKKSLKMLTLSLIYGTMNILSFIALRNIGAGVFTICAQLKILTTAFFSTILLKRKYSWTKWRAFITLILGVLVFSESVWGVQNMFTMENGNALLGVLSVITEVILSGFASIYFEKVVKTDSEHFNIWERNFQLAFWSYPMYFVFILTGQGNELGFLGGWSKVTLILSFLGASGGLLVALSIKYSDAILKTLATTGSIILSSLLDYIFLGGPLSSVMILSGGIVVTSICNYSFDTSIPVEGFVLEKDETKKPTERGSNEEWLK